MDAEEDGAGPSVVVVESDSAGPGPSATVTEVRNMVVLRSKSERSRRLRIGGARHDAHAYSYNIYRPARVRPASPLRVRVN